MVLQVSSINKGLDEQVEAFRNRPLQEEYPFIYVDALYEKIRSNKRVVSTAMMVAYGVGMDGRREVLAIGNHSASEKTLQKNTIKILIKPLKQGIL